MVAYLVALLVALMEYETVEPMEKNEAASKVASMASLKVACLAQVVVELLVDQKDFLMVLM